eukprot:m.250857 g.250857  ORF g.250857 m.250857 type:complete len:67 (+) comp15887_c0_seq15:6050-6250(+)
MFGRIWVAPFSFQNRRDSSQKSRAWCWCYRRPLERSASRRESYLARFLFIVTSTACDFLSHLTNES